MKRQLTILSIASFLVVVFAGVSYAQSTDKSNELDGDHLARISTNCISAKQAIRQVQRYDAGLRVNHGQAYEALTTRLMSRFNARVDSNGFNTRSLRAVTDFFNTTLGEFRESYRAYAAALSDALAVDCTNNPADFYTAVSAAAIAREDVHTSVSKLNDTIGEYHSAFDAFKTAFIERSSL